MCKMCHWFNKVFGTNCHCGKGACKCEGGKCQEEGKKCCGDGDCHCDHGTCKCEEKKDNAAPAEKM